MTNLVEELLAWAAFGTWWERYQGRDEQEYDYCARVIQDFVTCLPLPLFTALVAEHRRRRGLS
jgi:hypothetical protein